MGCPPDPIEISMSRSSNRIAELTDQYNELASVCKKALEYIKQISIRLPEEKQKKNQDFIGVFPGDSFEAREFDRRIIAYDESDPYRDANDLSSKEYYAGKEVKRLEYLYCEILHYINYELEYTSESEQETINKRLEYQQLYCKHRLEDVQTWLAWLNEKQQTYQYQFDNKDGAKKTKAQLILNKVEEEIKRITALSEETILKDRNSFGKNPEYFG